MFVELCAGARPKQGCVNITLTARLITQAAVSQMHEFLMVG